MPPIMLVGVGVGWFLVRHPVRVADSGRFTLDDARTKIRQARRSTRTRQETGEIDNFQARKNIVRSHSSPSNPWLTPLELWNSFFEKRGRAFLLVFCRRANRDERRFKEKAFGQAGLQSFFDNPPPDLA